MNRWIIIGMLVVAQHVTPQCGNGSSSSSGVPQNMVVINLNAGPTGDAFNVPFVSVTVCLPGQTSGCQTIDGVEVDTGSSGLRLLSSALTVALPRQTTTSGAAVVECFPFQDGYTWGPVATADIRVGSEQAGSVPIQIIGASGTPAAPDSCTSNGGAAENTLDTLGANGILGVGIFRQDCGPACGFVGSSNPGLYYACGSSGCQVTTESLTQQLQNPVWMFPQDNNGVLIQLPNVTPPGQVQASGLLFFGIGTQSNNALGNANVFTLDNSGNMTTTFGSTRSPGFIDSGSNGYYFLDTATTQIPTCADIKDFYCPTGTLTLSAGNIGANGRSNTVSFSIANADNFLNLPDSLLPQIGGPFAGYFDWGLPFFYGRSVFTAIEGQSTSGGVGPYFAY
ncbi:MAG TPA: DUF3443 domain-containing protein [Vicinamibacterales bacterium]